MSANEKDTETQEIPAQKDPAQPAAKAANTPDKKNSSAKTKKGKGLFGKKKGTDKKSDAGGENLKETVLKVKETWTEQSPKRKIIMIAIAAAIVAVAIIATIALNSQRSQYVVLYPSLEASEINDVYNAVKEKGVMPKIENGNVMVPSDQYNGLLLELASEGYPKSSLTYDISAKNDSITTTESDKKTNNLHQLQDRIQSTLKSISGVSNAIVTLNPRMTVTMFGSRLIVLTKPRQVYWCQCLATIH